MATEEMKQRMSKSISADADFLVPFREQRRTLLLPRPAAYGKYAVLKNQIIVLEGMPGVGKSTLGQAMVATLNETGVPATYLAERIDDAALKEYLADMRGKAAAFQMNALRNRMMVYFVAVQKASTGHAVVVDRGLVGDSAFAIMQRALGYFTDGEWDGYCAEVERARLKQASVLVHLSCTPEMAIRRIATRDNKAESVYDPVYMANYGAALDVAISLFHAGPGVTLNWDEDLTDSGNRVRLTDAKVAAVLGETARAFRAFYGL